MRLVIAVLLLLALAGPAAADPISLFVTVGLGLTGTAATVATAFIGAGVSLGLGYLSRRMQPQPSSGPQGMSLSLRVEPNEPREWHIGEVACAGSLEYHNTYGPNGNDYLQLVFALCDHETDGLVGMIVDGKPVTLGSPVSLTHVSGRTVSEYADCMWVEFHSGAWGQSADADLVAKAPGGQWPSTFRGRGITYARVTLKSNPEKFKAGLPRFVFVYRGAKMYDWRKDSTNGGSGSHRWGTESTYEYSDNPFVARYNYRRGVYVNGHRLCGMNTPATSLPVAAWTAAANVCDENVSLKSGGTEKRYRIAGCIPVNADHRTVLRDMITAAGGYESNSGGIFKPYAGAAQASVMTITDADLAHDVVSISPKVSRTELVNAVFGTYHAPDQNYEPTALPPRISPTDEAADGGVQLQEHYGLAFVTSGTQGQRILEILRRKGRFQRRVSCRLRSRFCVLEPGDWVTWDSDLFGFSGTFEVMQVALGRDLFAAVELREVASSIFAWNPAVDELDPLSPATVAAGGSTFTTVAGVALGNTTIIATGGAQRPGLTITWTPVTDATVVALKLEYRKIGDTVAIERTIQDPAAGTYTWLDGVQGNIEYEARLKPITLPERATNWTAWHQVPDEADPQVVDAAAMANDIPDGIVTHPKLSPQVAFELSLSSASDTVLGSLSEQVADTIAQMESLATAAIRTMLAAKDNSAQIRVEQRLRIEEDLSLAEQITTAVANFNSSAALVQNQITALSAVDQALASQIDTVSATVDGQTVTVTVLQQAIDGMEGKWGVAVSQEGYVLGLVQLEAGAVEGSTFTVVADKFQVAFPGQAGGGAVPVFSIQNVGGVAKLALRGDMLADGTITASKIAVSQLSALTADLGTVIAGLIRNSANTIRFDLPNMRQYRTDGKVDFNMGDTLGGPYLKMSTS